jgi:hypothetical protein
VSRLVGFPLNPTKKKVEKETANSNEYAVRALIVQGQTPTLHDKASTQTLASLSTMIFKNPSALATSRAQQMAAASAMVFKLLSNNFAICNFC